VAGLTSNFPKDAGAPGSKGFFEENIQKIAEIVHTKNPAGVTAMEKTDSRDIPTRRKHVETHRIVI
jgi:hypothetical protein